MIDFGLSFNSQDPELSDLTRVNEEVGNRFLRLPEHSTGGRSPVSDVTQLIGLLFFVLTGLEPRTLVDQDGHKPHQRAEAHERLSAVFTGQHLLRILSLFDRGFDPRLSTRPQSASMARDLLHCAFSAAGRDGDSLDELLGQLDHEITQPHHQDVTTNARRLQFFSQSATQLIRRFAASRQLNCSQGGGPNDFTGSNPYCLLRLALSPSGVIPQEFVEFRFELRGMNDVVLSTGSEEIWRGADPNDPNLADVLIRPVVALFLGRHR